jgi:hypothetical protein
MGVEFISVVWKGYLQILQRRGVVLLSSAHNKENVILEERLLKNPVKDGSRLILS